MRSSMLLSEMYSGKPNKRGRGGLKGSSEAAEENTDDVLSYCEAQLDITRRRNLKKKKGSVDDFEGYSFATLEKLFALASSRSEGEGTLARFVGEKEKFLERQEEARKTFVEDSGWTENDYKITSSILTNCINRCASCTNPGGALMVYRMLGLIGHNISSPNLAALLSTLYPFPKYDSALVDIGNYHRCLHEPDEKVTCIVVKSLARAGRIDEALSLLAELEEAAVANAGKVAVEAVEAAAIEEEGNNETNTTNTNAKKEKKKKKKKAKKKKKNNKHDSPSQVARLRTYLPILDAMVAREPTDANAGKAVGFFGRMIEKDGVHLTEEEYVSIVSYLFRAMAASRPKSSDSPPSFPLILEVASKSPSFAHASSSISTVVSCILDQLSKTSLSIGEREAARLVESGSGKAKLSRVDKYTGECESTGIKLGQIKNSPSDKEAMVHAIQGLADNRFRAYYVANKTMIGKNGDDFAEVKIKEFREWLKQGQKKYTVIIDGANVAYYGQNHDNGRFNYNQIASVVAALEREGEHCLVVMPQKYCNKSFLVRTGMKNRTISNGGDGQGAGKRELVTFRQRLTPEEEQFIKVWRERRQLYIAPYYVLDDYYWMLAGLQEASQGAPLVREGGVFKGEWDAFGVYIYIYIYIYIYYAVTCLFVCLFVCLFQVFVIRLWLKGAASIFIEAEKKKKIYIYI